MWKKERKQNGAINQKDWTTETSNVRGRRRKEIKKEERDRQKQKETKREMI